MRKVLGSIILGAALLLAAAAVPAFAWGIGPGAAPALPSNAAATYLIFQNAYDSGCGPDDGVTLSPLVGKVQFVWSWEGTTCKNLGVPLAAYNTGYRFAWNHDVTGSTGNKDITYFLDNMPWLVEYTTPVLAVTGIATNGSPTITGLSINPTTTAGLVASTTTGAGSFITDLSGATITGSEIQSDTSSSITLGSNVTVGGGGSATVTFDLYTPAWYLTDYKDVPVNFTDPTWRNFLFKNCSVVGTSHSVGCSLNGEIEAGFSWVGYDNLLLNNQYTYVGHFERATASCAQTSWPKCGGTWKQDFSGANYGDPAWIKGVLDYLRYTADYVHGYGAGLAVNLNIGAGGGAALAPQTLQQAAIIADATLTEAGAINSAGQCQYGDAWKQIVETAQSITEPFMYDEDSVTFSTAASPQGTVEQCIISTLLMMANSKSDGSTNTYLSVQGTADAYNVVTYDPSWLTAEQCGAASPNNLAYINGGGSWERDFPADKCIAVYNPAQGTTTTWTPPVGMTFTDFLNGGTYTGGTPYNITAPSGQGYGTVFIRTS